MNKIKKFKYVLIFLAILILGGILSAFGSWETGIFTTKDPMTIISGILMLVGIVGFVWQAVKLNKKIE